MLLGRTVDPALGSYLVPGRIEVPPGPPAQPGFPVPDLLDTPGSQNSYGLAVTEVGSSYQVTFRADNINGGRYEFAGP